MLKQVGFFFSTFVAFSEYLNFIQHDFDRYEKDWYQFRFLSQSGQILFKVAFQLFYYFVLVFDHFKYIFLLIFIKICWKVFQLKCKFKQIWSHCGSTMNYKQIIFKCHAVIARWKCDRKCSYYLALAEMSWLSWHVNDKNVHPTVGKFFNFFLYVLQI